MKHRHPILDDNRYNNPILDKIDGLIDRMGLQGSSVAVDGGTVHVYFNNQQDAQAFGRFIRKNNFEEITLREEGENLWFMTADVVMTRKVGAKKNSGEDMDVT